MLELWAGAILVFEFVTAERDPLCRDRLGGDEHRAR